MTHHHPAAALAHPPGRAPSRLARAVLSGPRLQWALGGCVIKVRWVKRKPHFFATLRCSVSERRASILAVLIPATLQAVYRKRLRSRAPWPSRRYEACLFPSGGHCGPASWGDGSAIGAGHWLRKAEAPSIVATGMDSRRGWGGISEERIQEAERPWPSLAEKTEDARVPDGCRRQGVVDAQTGEGAAPLGEESHPVGRLGAPMGQHLSQLRQRIVASSNVAGTSRPLWQRRNP